MAATVLATQATQAAIDRLAEHYVFRDPEAVAGFVRRHPEVVAPLLEAVAVVPRYFGESARLALEVERDRDGSGGRTDLFALIRTDFDIDAALAALRRFDDEWWLDALRQANGRLMFGIEYA